jgi:hypothetical protein
MSADEKAIQNCGFFCLANDPAIGAGTFREKFRLHVGNSPLAMGIFSPLASIRFHHVDTNS